MPAYKGFLRGKIGLRYLWTRTSSGWRASFTCSNCAKSQVQPQERNNFRRVHWQTWELRKRSFRVCNNQVRLQRRLQHTFPRNRLARGSQTGEEKTEHKVCQSSSVGHRGDSNGRDQRTISRLHVAAPPSNRELPTISKELEQLEDNFDPLDWMQHIEVEKAIGEWLGESNHWLAEFEYESEGSSP